MALVIALRDDTPVSTRLLVAEMQRAGRLELETLVVGMQVNTEGKENARKIRSPGEVHKNTGSLTN